MPSPAGVIINPISGTGGRPAVARRRLDEALAALRARGIAEEPRLTERPGHGYELARELVAGGTRLIIAWGGDGTVNEVASALAYTDATLAIIPSGSGNGLARELGISRDPSAAFETAFAGADVMMDAGELDGRLFFNVAGVGFDARVAYVFAAGGLVRRGFSRYLRIAARELFAFVPDDHSVIVDGTTIRTRALMIAIANARQYGNGAVIAPCARIDDGLLDVVVVTHRSPWAVVRQLPRLFSGQIARVPGVVTLQGRTIEIGSAQPVLYHVDGETFVGGASLKATVRPGALRIRIPRSKVRPVALTRGVASA